MRKSFFLQLLVFKNLKLSAIKTALLALVPFFLHLKFTFAGGFPNIAFPNISEVFPTLPALAGALLVYYELLARLVPSLENNSLFHIAGQILNAIVPNHAVTDDGGVGYHVQDDAIAPKPGAGGTGLSVA